MADKKKNTIISVTALVLVAVLSIASAAGILLISQPDQEIDVTAPSNGTDDEVIVDDTDVPMANPQNDHQQTLQSLWIMVGGISLLWLILTLPMLVSGTIGLMKKAKTHMKQ